MSKHRAPRRHYQLWQLMRLVNYQTNLVKLWINEQRADLPDILNQLRNK